MCSLLSALYVVTASLLAKKKIYIKRLSRSVASIEGLRLTLKRIGALSCRRVGFKVQSLQFKGLGTDSQRIGVLSSRSLEVRV